MAKRLSLRVVTPYLHAFAIVLLAFILRLAVANPVGARRLPFVTFFPAVAYCAWRCGLGPSVFAAIVSVVAAWYAFFPPQFSFRLDEPVLALSSFAAFLFGSAIMIALGESNRRGREQLEHRVCERTAQLSAVQVDLSAANENLHALAARLLQVSDEERRRIARELHDGVGQFLTAISMNLSTIGRTQLTAEAACKLSDTEELTQEAIRQTRTISHLLHPPLLDELGLAKALAWYIEGFSERSGIPVALSTPKDFERPDRDTEMAVFRVVQECLNNIHRHSQATAGSVELAQHPEGLLLTISDNGKGMSLGDLNGRHDLPGVGISGMRERLEQLGGKLQLESTSRGTKIVGTLPVHKGTELQVP